MPGMLHEVVDLKSAPVWLKLWHVPLELYSQKGLGCIANALGRPLYSDRATMLKHSLEYAKICVEVEANAELPTSVLVELSEGTCVEVGVELVWAPPRCVHCCTFGHLEEKCLMKATVVVASNSGESHHGLQQGNSIFGTIDSDHSVEPMVAVVESISIGNDGIGDTVESVEAVNDVAESVDTVVAVHESAAAAIVISANVDIAEIVNVDNVVVETVVDFVNAETATTIETVVDYVHVEGIEGLELDANSFDIDEKGGSPRKVRVAADGVAVLMNQLKPKGKGGGGNKKKGKGGKRVVVPLIIDVISDLECAGM
ncbi:hypothetical protein V6N12_001274 [Hibiscus sabdariffa]|uniref:DUF4283 domain-containing protein n=1 Tax=Hibiscus sabdariffa TaxID=183260 RepID=A0ABR2C8C5_9ROSI